MTTPSTTLSPVEIQASKDVTWEHIHRLGQLLDVCVIEILTRRQEHDQTKLKTPEVEVFAEHSPKLAHLTFGMPDYDESKQLVDMALKHHFARNRHHPEYHKNGVDDMNLVDVLEMLCDWMSSSERQHNGNIRLSLEENARKHRISPQLIRIMENTVRMLE